MSNLEEYVYQTSWLGNKPKAFSSSMTGFVVDYFVFGRRRFGYKSTQLKREREREMYTLYGCVIGHVLVRLLIRVVVHNNKSTIDRSALFDSRT